MCKSSSDESGDFSESKAVCRSQSPSFVLVLQNSCSSLIFPLSPVCIRHCINAPRQGSFLVAHSGKLDGQRLLHEFVGKQVDSSRCPQGFSVSFSVYLKRFKII